MGRGYRIDVFNNTTRTLHISSGATGNISSNGVPDMQLAPGVWAGTANSTPNQPYYVELNGDTGFITLDVEVVNFGPGSFTIQFDTDALQNYQNGSAFFALPGNGLKPIEVAEGSATGWIFASLYLANFGQWTEVLIVLLEATGASSTVQPPYQID